VEKIDKTAANWINIILCSFELVKILWRTNKTSTPFEMLGTSKSTCKIMLVCRVLKTRLLNIIISMSKTSIYD